MSTPIRNRLLTLVGLLAIVAAAMLLLNSLLAHYVAVGLLLIQALAVALLLRRPPVEVETPPEPVVESFSSFDTTVLIGDETLSYMRRGLNEESAQKICEIIHKITPVDAVAITDKEKILGFHGIGCRRHRQGGKILTGATRKVLDSGETAVVTDPSILSCDEADCPHPLKSAVITPLKHRGKVAGTFKLYRSTSGPLPSDLVRLAVGIAAVLGLQMELAEADRHRQLVTKARLEALQAQIRPHFLFNVLNTIIMFSRTDPEKSRELLINLAQFFRKSLSHQGSFITLKDELDYINTYLSLEKARFGDKLTVKMRIDPRLFTEQVPILTLQPLVENAVVHGLAPKEHSGTIGIRAHRVQDEVRIFIVDNGIGMDREQVRRVFEEGFGQNMGLGLSNVNDRLMVLFGDQYGLKVRSLPGRGTAIRVRIPIIGSARV